jgi:hypothetical protein
MPCCAPLSFVNPCGGATSLTKALAHPIDYLLLQERIVVVVVQTESDSESVTSSLTLTKESGAQQGITGAVQKCHQVGHKKADCGNPAAPATAKQQPRRPATTTATDVALLSLGTGVWREERQEFELLQDLCAAKFQHDSPYAEVCVECQKEPAESTDCHAGEEETAALVMVLDSGTTSHMTGERDGITELRTQTETIKLGDNVKTIVSEGRGKLGKLEDVMYAPELKYTLVSIPKFDKQGRYTVFGGGKAVVLNEAPVLRGEAVFTGTLQSSGLYELDQVTQIAAVAEDEASGLPVHDEEQHEREQQGVHAQEITAKQRRKTVRRSVMGSFGTTRPGCTVGHNLLQILHRRLGHINPTAMENLLRHNSVTGAGTTYEAIKNMVLGPCDGCMRGKMTADNVPSSVSRDRSVMRPMQTIAMDPVPMVQTSLHGNEYATVGIDLATSYVWAVPSKSRDVQVEVIDYVHREVAQRYGHTIELLWTDRDSVYLAAETLRECRELGIRCEQSPPYVHEHNGAVERVVRTLSDMTRTMLLDAELPQSYWEHALDMAVHAYNVTLHPQTEVLTPTEKLTGIKPDVSLLRPFGAWCWYYVHEEERQVRGARWEPRAKVGRVMGYADNVPGTYIVLTQDNPPVLRVRKQVVVFEGDHEQVMGRIAEQQLDAHAALGDEVVEGQAARKPPDKHPNAEHTSTSPRRTARKPVPNPRYDETHVAVEEGQKVLPRSVSEALNGPDASHWTDAIATELDNYKFHKVLKPVNRADIPRGSTIPDLKQVFVAKQVSQSERKYKFRLAIRGFAQKYGKDYEETYSPTVMVKTVKLILHLAAHFGWNIEHIDIGCAYMEAPAERKMFVRVAADLVAVGFCESEHAELGANAYGIKQGGRVFHVHEAHKLLAFGCGRCASDVCVFTKWDPGGTMVVIVFMYVDDLGITGNWIEEIQRLREYLRQEFRKIKVTSPMLCYIGMELQWKPEEHRVVVGQSFYCREMVNGLHTDITAAIPLPYTVDYHAEAVCDQAPIWEELGQVRYLADRTRPDLAAAAGILGSYAAHPAEVHLRGMRHLMKYCKATSEVALNLGGDSAIRAEFHCDASFNMKHDCRPTYGYTCRLATDAGVILHRSKKAPTVATSVGEAEARAAAEAAREVVWVRDMLAELGLPQDLPTMVFTDSQAVMDIVSNFRNNPRTGCFNKDVQWLRECVDREVLQFVKVKGEENQSDALTKLLDKDTVQRHREEMTKGKQG